MSIHKKGSTMRKPTVRLRRLRLEPLADRTLLAVGLFIENFSDDLDLSLPGFDESDIYPSRDINPNDPRDTTYDDPATINTVAPDELQIINDLPRHGPTTPVEINGQFLYHRYLFPGGPTAQFGSYNIREWDPANNPGETLPNGHYLFVRTGLIGGPLVDFSFPVPAGEEVSLLAFSVQGFGGYRVEGTRGVLELPLQSSSWQRVVIGQDHLLPGGLELGPIRSLSFIAGHDGGIVSLDDLTVMVAQTVVNRPPVATDDALIVDRETGVTGFFSPLSNDNDPDFDSFAMFTHTEPDPALGTLRVDRGNYFFTASEAFRLDPSLGPATFAYTIRDDRGAFDSATVTIHGFFGVPDVYTVPHGTKGGFGVLSDRGVFVNDRNPLAAPRSIRLWENGLHGNFTLFPNGSFSYTARSPEALVNGDSFSYELGTGDFVEIVPVHLNVPNQRPVAGDGQFFLAHGTPGPLRSELFAEDADADVLSLRLAAAPRHGQLTIFRVVNGVAEFEYTPNAGDFRGYDFFTYYVHDGYSPSNTARIEFIVPNTPPILRDDPNYGLLLQPSTLQANGSTTVQDTLVFLEDLEGNLLRTAFDLDDDPFTFVQVTDPGYLPLHGDVVIAPDGSFTYTPRPDPSQSGFERWIFGRDTFYFRVFDGYEYSEIGAAEILQDLGPAITRTDAYTVAHDDELSVGGLGVLDNDGFASGLGLVLRNGRVQFVESVHGSYVGPTSSVAGEVVSSYGEFPREEDGMGIDDGQLEDTGEFTFRPRLTGIVSLSYSFRYLSAGLNSPYLRSPTARILINVTEHPEADSDGIRDGIENQLPVPGGADRDGDGLPDNGGDGNGDGVRDSHQDHVASRTVGLFTNTDNDRWVTFVSAPGTSLFAVDSIGNPSPSDTPTNAKFSMGFFSFYVVGLAPGESTTVTIYPHDPRPINSYYKWGGPQRGWYEFLYDGQTGAELFDNDEDGRAEPEDSDGMPSRIVLHFVDGQRGDEDSREDGIIYDPGGPAFIGPPKGPLLVTSADARGGPHVRAFDALTMQERFSFFAYDRSFTGGVRVATGDVNGDGTLDIITAAGPGGGPHVRVFDGTTGEQLPSPIGSFFAYSPGFTGGVFVAAADFNHDGFDDLVTGAGTGGGPHVRVFSGATGEELASFLDPPKGGNGVRVATGYIDSDTTPDIITGSGPGVHASVRVFSGLTGLPIAGPLANLAPYPGFLGGVHVAAGDINADGRDDIITGADAGGGPHVKAFSGLDGAEIASYFAYSPAFHGGVRVGVGDVNHDGWLDIITGAGPGGGPHVQARSGRDRAELASFFAYDNAFTGGVFIAGALPKAHITAPESNPVVASEPVNAASKQQWDLIRAAAFMSDDSDFDFRRLNPAKLADAVYSQW